MPSTAISQRVVIVLGMHRSGTSALTGALHHLGIHVGDRLLPAMSDNPEGFWEHVDIVNLHERVLATLGTSWNDERCLPSQWWLRPEMEIYRAELAQIIQRDFEASPLWMVKDPRMCRLIPLWHTVLKRAGCKPSVIFILRDPREVAQSLARRDGISIERSCLLWLQHLVEAEQWTRDYPRSLVTYEALLSDWKQAIAVIARNLSLELPTDSLAVQNRVSAFLKKDLRHHLAPPLSSEPLCRLALHAYETASSPNVAPDELGATLSSIASQVAELLQTTAPWASEIQRVRNQLTNHVRELDHCTRELDLRTKELSRIKGTVSWRVTKPLRGIYNKMLKPWLAAAPFAGS